MKVRRDSLLYQFWQHTFLFSIAMGGPITFPAVTTRLRFGLRMFLLLPIGFILLCLWVLWAAFTFIGNLLTILSGAGYFITWGIVYHVRPFKGFVIRNEWVSPRVIAGVLWIILVAGFFGHRYPNEVATYGFPVLLVIVCMVAAVLGMRFADDMEREDGFRMEDSLREAEEKGKEIPPEFITFVDPDDGE